MKTVKLWYSGFWDDFDYENNLFSDILKKRYTVVLDEQDPDFLICSPLGTPFEYMRYECPRIVFTGEPMCADFTVIDYFIGFDDISFGDRAMRFPLHLCWSGRDNPREKPLTEDEAVKILRSKAYFCNFIYGHQTQLGLRESILDTLSTYKRVECAGSFRNNMPDGKRYNMHNKWALMEKCKFSIAAESVPYRGFASEKMVNALETRTIPIYSGNVDIAKEFNADAFVQCTDFSSLEPMLKKVIEIDNDDDLYIHMLCQNWYVEADYVEKKYQELENFLYHIFDQDKEEAYRRLRYCCSNYQEAWLKHYMRMYGTIPYRLDRKRKYLMYKIRRLLGSEEEIDLLVK